MANKLFTVKRGFGTASTRFQVGRASGTLTGLNQGCGVSITAGESPIVLSHILYQIVNLTGTTLSQHRVMVVTGDIPDDLTPWQTFDVTNPVVADQQMPGTFGSSMPGALLWERFVIPANGTNNTTTPQPSVQADFTSGPIVAPGETLSVMAFPMVNKQAADYTSDLWLTLSVWGRSAFPGEAVGSIAGASAAGLRSLPRGAVIGG